MHSKKNKIKNPNVANCRKRKIPENEAVINMAKKSKHNTKKSIFDTDTGTLEYPMSDTFAQPFQNPPANCCEFQTNEENNVTLQSLIPDNVGGKHGQALTNEIDFDNLTICNEELHKEKSFKENMKKFHKALKFQIFHCHVCL